MPRPEPPLAGSYAAAPRRRTSIRRRLLAAFVFLALIMSAALGIVGRLSFDSLATYLVGWHARPVMEAFIEAEKRAWEAEDNGGGNLYYGEDLAVVMHWRFLVGKQVPQPWQEMPDGLHFINHMEEFILIERRDDVIYVLTGGTGAFLALKQRLNRILLLCAVSGLALAVVLAVVLSRRLTGPLSRLTTAVESRPPERMQANAQETPDGLAPIPLTGLDDEVGVLARAIAAREEALQRFVLRESNFTGDVSHELRTPLTVMQGGLEILELQLQRLPQAESLAPVVQRLLRTTARMSNTVRTLLMLARRPEEIEFQTLDCSALLWGIVREMEGDGLLHCSSASDRLPDPDRDIITAFAPAEASFQPSVSGTDVNLPEAATAIAPRHTGKNAVGRGPEQRSPVALQTYIAPTVRARGQKELAAIVFNNLLDNACQYTENGRASVSLCQGELLVRNRGCIPPGVDIFARGVRCTQKAVSGSGLGLSLALRACERLGWRLDMVSDPADGEAVFRVIFPPISQGVDI
ncbi:sensor histidine kinase [Desulfovibrio desulfuricans]|uniref:sensor histidine kinase n=1 Tax=Desulfovibrio desulfuricans TaxID=876 RepID=UPI001AE144C7|nr:HAMP domain-containing sensor histidine kinase [Desulfovibrio desulfuricans]MDD3683225.1 HAMP domain-containing sensor histidine kinase [Desulfovibrio desulfuricans]QTO41091.1 HAMP domain-containing histidine kinase [Desulfovibrio desulfuricans]